MASKMGADAKDDAMPLVTIVVTPRERFSVAVQSLSSVIDHTPPHYPVLYVDPGTPDGVLKSLHSLANGRNIEFIPADCLGTPNTWRNTAAKQVLSKYICFMDNDVIVSSNWIDILIRQAEDTGADITHPLILFESRERDMIHHAGGRITVNSLQSPPSFQDHHHLANRQYSKHSDSLVLRESDYAEFHCMLVRMSRLSSLGFLDESLLSVHEHIDLSLQVTKNENKIYFCPSSVVYYIRPSRDSPLCLYDLEFYLRRWSTTSNHSSVKYFCEKWGFLFDNNNPPSALISANNRLRFTADIFSRPYRNSSKPGEHSSGNLSQNRDSYTYIFPALARQCLDAGFSYKDLLLLREAFDLACSIHKNALRRSRLLFVEHCVGVASILCIHGAGIELICAGLVHAIYLQGTTAGHNVISPTQSTRQRIRKLLGFAIEDIVYEYSFRPSLGNDDGHHEIDELSVPICGATIIRVANELEECLHDKLFYENKVGAGRRWSISFLDRVAPLMQRCGYDALIDEARERYMYIADVYGTQHEEQYPPRWFKEIIAGERRLYSADGPAATNNRYIQQRIARVKALIPYRIRKTRVMQYANKYANIVLRRF